MIWPVDPSVYLAVSWKVWVAGALFSETIDAVGGEIVSVATVFVPKDCPSCPPPPSGVRTLPSGEVSPESACPESVSNVDSPPPDPQPESPTTKSPNGASRVQDFTMGDLRRGNGHPPRLPSRYIIPLLEERIVALEPIGIAGSAGARCGFDD